MSICFQAYKILDVSKASTDIEIKAAHRLASRRHHPDKGGNPVEFDKVQKAYALLHSGAARARLNTKLQGLGEDCPECHGVGYKRKFRRFVQVGIDVCEVCNRCGYIERQ